VFLSHVEVLDRGTIQAEVLDCAVKMSEDREPKISDMRFAIGLLCLGNLLCV